MIIGNNENNEKLNNIPFDNDEDYISNYILKNTQTIINNNLCEFIRDESYKEIKNDLIKNKIFNFSSFINSCKSYDDISTLKNDIEIFSSQIENEENIYHIIYNYLNNVFQLISEDNFFEEEINLIELSIIIEKIDECLKKNDNNDDKINNEIILIKNKILKILRKSKKVSKHIIKIVNILEQNEKKFNKNADIIEKEKKNNDIHNHFEASNIYTKITSFGEKINHNEDNDNKNKFLTKNKAFITDNSVYNSINCSTIYSINEKKDIKQFNNITNRLEKVNLKNNSKNNEEKETTTIPFNYENLMCPPINSDDSD